MSSDKDSERVIKRARAETQRLATAIEKAEGSDVRKIASREQAVARYQKLCDESPSQFSNFLKLMSDKSSQSTRILAAMEGYLLNKVSSIISQLRASPIIGSEDKALFENLQMLARLDEKYKEAIFSELSKPENKEKMGVLVSHLLSHGVFSREEINEKFSTPEPSVKMAILVDTLMRSKTTGSTTISTQVSEIKKLAESDPGARAVLLSSIMSLGYATDRNVNDISGKLLSLILSEDREGALRWNYNELDSVLSHMGKFVQKDNPSKNLYNWNLVEEVQNLRNKSMQEMGLGGAGNTVKSSVDAIDMAGQTKKTPDDIAKEVVRSLVGLGIKSDVNTSRWVGLTGNAFMKEDGTAQVGIEFRGVMLKSAQLLDIVRLNSDNKITDVNWSRALNPFVLAEYALLGLEVGIHKVGSFFGDHTTARTAFQAPIVALLRTIRLPFEFLGKATSVSGLPDRYGDAKNAEKAVTNSVSNYKGKMQSFNFDKHANTPWAIQNFMYTQRKEGTYTNVKTVYDEQIAQILVSRKNSSDDSRSAAIEVMAYRNTLAEYEGKKSISSSDKLVIESVKAKLETALNKLRNEVSKEAVKEESKEQAIQHGGETMTDTTRRASRTEAATEESRMSLNLQGVEAKEGVDTSRRASVGSDTESEGVSESSSSSRERTTLLEEEKAEVSSSLLGRLRQAVGRLFGGAGAETKMEPKVGAYEYNQVVLKRFAERVVDEKDSFKKWVDAHQEALGGVNGIQEVNGKVEITFPIEFGNGQRIEKSKEGDLVMKGFSAEAYEGFRKEMISDRTRPELNISAQSGKSITKIEDSLRGNNSPTIISRLTSIGLFIQQVGSSIKSFFTGPPTPAPQTANSQAAVTTAEESSKVSVERSAPTPSPAPSATAGQKRGAEPQVAELFEPEKKRQKIGSSTANAIPQWASRTVVTVASNNDLDAIRTAIQEYAKSQNFSAIGVDDKKSSITYQLVDKDGGRLNISAKQGEAQVVIVEMKSSDNTPHHIANIATNLPNPGQKDVFVEGRKSIQENVVKALEAVSHKVNPVKEEKAQNQATSSPRH